MSDQCEIHDIPLVPVDGDLDCLTCTLNDQFTESPYPGPDVPWEPGPMITSGEYLARVAYWKRARGDKDA